MQDGLGHCRLNCRVEFNLQLEPVLQIRSAKTPLLWEASLPLSIMDFTNRVFPALPPFFGFERTFSIEIPTATTTTEDSIFIDVLGFKVSGVSVQVSGPTFPGPHFRINWLLFGLVDGLAPETN